MENVVLIIHLLLALSLIGVVLLQRSEGGGLGMGGGGGGATAGRPSATPLGKVTWLLAIAFICTSLTLTIFAAANASGTSIMDRLGGSAPTEAPAEGTTPALPTDGLLPPPSGGSDAPLVPRAD
ncbi:preprotein translocase subunit SecG [Thalassococcus sp. BH17M4-6]|uniref:preprotein translocase subunit SecG n=1 Tax=Thalassococcus sp. BH17M4-6 TaxID=3413148 RepID=UPI003BC90580